MDVRPGKGRFAHILGEGKAIEMHGGYREVEPLTCLSCTSGQGEGNDHAAGRLVALLRRP